MAKFNKINGRWVAEVPCPDCGLLHFVSHKNYYSQQSGKHKLSFRCRHCGILQAARTRRNPKLTKTNHGYIKLYRPENPMADKRGEVYEHRLVMSEILGRPLETWEIIHHKDGNRANNHPSNLELHPSSEHITITRLQNRVKQLESLLSKNQIDIPLLFLGK